MRVVEAVAADAAALVRLWHACGLTRPWNDPEGDFLRAIEGLSSCVLVAREESAAIVASVMVGSDGHRGWVYYLASDPAHRGQGLGRAMMRAAEDWLKGRGITRIRLMVRAGNPAEGFYRRLGYDVQEVSTFGRTLV